MSKIFLVYKMFIGSIIALTLSLSLLVFLVVFIVIQRVRTQRKMQAEQERLPPTPTHTVIPSNFIAPGAMPPPSRRGGPNIVGKPVL